MAGLNGDLEYEVREIIRQCRLARDYEATLTRRMVALITDRETRRQIRRGLDDVALGRTKPLEQVRRELGIKSRSKK